jgi:septal ring factor EnvC (AmiA/AmiB activator)
MLYFALGMTVLAAIAGVIAASMVSKVKIQKAEIGSLTTEKKELIKEKGDIQAKLDGEVGRRESLISELKKEIETLEKDLESCRDPAVVRSRLRKLFTVSEGSNSSST